MAAQLIATKGAQRSRTVLIDRQRRHFLSRAAFTGNQDRYALRGDSTNGLVNLTHRRAHADDGAFDIGLRCASVTTAGSRISRLTSRASSITRRSCSRSSGLKR